MRKRHRLVLLGDFNLQDVSEVFRKRGIRIHTPLAPSPKSPTLEGVICFNPKRISAKRIINILTADKYPQINVGLEKIDTDKENCHDCQKVA